MTRTHLISASLFAIALTPLSALHPQEDSQAPPRIRAQDLEKQGRTAEAEKLWEEIATSDPQNAEALGHLGLLEARQDHYESAIDYYRRAASIKPDIPGLEMNLGLVLFKAAQFPAAIKIFSSEIEKHPGDQRLTILLGMAHYGMKDYLVAIPWLRHAADNDTQNSALRLTLAHSCLESKQYRCVLAVHKEIQALHADSPEADLLAAEALDQMHDSASAAQQLRAALLLNPKEPNAHFALGYLLWRQNQFAQAAAEFQLELQNNPQHPSAQLYLADSQQQMNQTPTRSPRPPHQESLQELIDSLESPAP